MNYENALLIFAMLIVVIGFLCFAELFAYMLHWK